jgi:hypothetical protein
MWTEILRSSSNGRPTRPFFLLERPGFDKVAIGGEGAERAAYAPATWRSPAHGTPQGEGFVVGRRCFESPAVPAAKPWAAYAPAARRVPGLHWVKPADRASVVQE